MWKPFLRFGWDSSQQMVFHYLLILLQASSKMLKIQELLGVNFRIKR
jgi:hypothetical protein